MTLASGIHKGAWSTFFHITEYQCFRKIQCFTFSPFKSPRDQIWPWRKIGQGQPRVTIWTNLAVLSPLMLHNKFQGNQPRGSGEDNFSRFCTIYGHCGHLAVYEIWLKLAQQFQKRSHLKKFIHSILVTIGQGHWMTLASGIHKGAWSTFIHITEYHCFGKIQCFTFLHSKAQVTKFDHDEKWIKVNLGSPFEQTW